MWIGSKTQSNNDCLIFSDMSQTFRKILQLVKNKEIKISAHGYDELSNDNIYFRDIINSITEGKVIEDYSLG